MSRTAKSFLVASIAITTATVWGVHFIQAREEEAMYQGVVKDEARILARAALKSSTAAAPPTTNQTTATYTGPTVAPPTIPLSARRAEYSRNLALQQSLEEEQGMERARKEKEAYEKDREEVRRRGL